MKYLILFLIPLNLFAATKYIIRNSQNQIVKVIESEGTLNINRYLRSGETAQSVDFTAELNARKAQALSEQTARANKKAAIEAARARLQNVDLSSLNSETADLILVLL